jgi:membrane protein
VYVARKTVREFSRDQCTDLAAALTYYAVLALFPTAIALLSLVSVFGQGPSTVDFLLRIVSDAGGSSVAKTLRPTLETLSQTTGAGLALVLGLLGALWSASGYVGAFGRAMNRIYAIGEGRPAWKLRPAMFLVTLLLVVLAAVAILALIVSGPLTQSLGSALGLGPAAVLAWRLAKWPILLIVVLVIVATLYYAPPNVKQTKFSLAQRRRSGRDHHLGALVGGVRLLRGELLELQQDLRRIGRGHRLPVVAVDHQPRPALGR